MNRKCETCSLDYDLNDRKNKPGKITQCNECAEENGDVEKYTANMIYSHKTGCSIQINKDSRLTDYINKTTELKNKGSNMTSNINEVSRNKKLIKTEDACLVVADCVDYKGKNQ